MENTLEITALEEILNVDAVCQSNHVSRNRVCTKTVTHRVTLSCGVEAYVCAASFGWYGIYVEEMRGCSYCGQLIKNCWTVIPV